MSSAASHASPTAPIAVIVPCYNEADRLPTRTFLEFAQAHPQISFLFFNDGSRDGTEAMLQELAEQHEAFTTMSLEHNSGKAEAVRQGMLKAFERGATYTGFWDADLATPLTDIPAFADLLDSRPDIEMVFGSRVNLLGRSIKRKAIRHYLGRVFATVASTMLGIAIYDTQCGAKLFRVSDNLEEVFQEPFISKWVFDVEIIARLIQSRRDSDLPAVGEIIYEYPLLVWEDVAGSKIRQRDFIVVGSDLMRIYTRYLRG